MAKVIGWLPVDAEPNPDKKDKNPNIAHWISGQEIFDLIKENNAKNVLLIADNCEAGMFLQTTCNISVEKHSKGGSKLLAEFPDHFNAILKKIITPSRLVLTSSGTENAKDAVGEGEHSVFAQPLIDSLKKGKNLTAFDLYGDIFNEIVYKVPQRPRYVPLASDTEGDFVFLSKEIDISSSKPQKPNKYCQVQNDIDELKQAADNRNILEDKWKKSLGFVTKELNKRCEAKGNVEELRTILFQQQKLQAKEELEKRCKAIKAKQQAKSLHLANLAQTETEKGSAVNGILLALEGLPKNNDRLLIEAEEKLYSAVLNQELQMSERLILEGMMLFLVSMVKLLLLQKEIQLNCGMLKPASFCTVSKGMKI